LHIPKDPIRSVVIANIAEFNRRAMIRGFTRNEYEIWDSASVDLSDMALFWHGDDKLVILPRKPDETFVSDVKNALQYRNLQVISPAKRSTSLCSDILADHRLRDFLIDRLRNSQKPKIVVWGATDQFYSLINELRRAGADFQVSEVPSQDNYWTALYLESKAGFRELTRNLQSEIPDLNLPEGFICGSKELAVEAIAHFWSRQKGFVLKANYGTAGFSVLCYPASQLARGLETLRKDALHRMSFDHFWDNPPVIIEEHIAGPEELKPDSLTVDFIIDKNSVVKLVGTGKMLMRRKWLYSGIQSGLGVIESDTEEKINCIGRQVGCAIASMGYKGWFDIDFVVSAENRIFLTEINARRASPAHVFDIASHVFGRDWFNRCSCYANDHLRLQGSCYPSYYDIRKTLANFNSENSNYAVRAIPTIISSSISRKTPYLGYVVLAEHTSNARFYALKLEDQIRQSVGMNLDSFS
jgi:hypothetical protein